MKILLTIMCLVCTQIIFAQKTIDVTKSNSNIGQSEMYAVGGVPFVNVKFVRLVEGSPYFQDEWRKGSVVLKSGQEFSNVPVKLDLYDNQLHFRGKDSVDYVSTAALKEVRFTDAIGRTYDFYHSSNLPPLPSSAKAGWYMSLTQGTASLFVFFNKQFTEQRPYGSATTEQSIRTVETYWLLHNNTFTQVKKTKDIPDILSDKKTELENFIKTDDDKKASLNDRFTAVVNYYNLLFAEKK